MPSDVASMGRGQLGVASKVPARASDQALRLAGPFFFSPAPSPSTDGRVCTCGEVVEVPPPTNDEVCAVLRRVVTLARRDFEAAEAAFGDEEDEYGALQAAAVQRPLALGESPPRRRPAKRVAVAQGLQPARGHGGAWP
jgi:hypothetical protein